MSDDFNADTDDEYDRQKLYHEWYYKLGPSLIKTDPNVQHAFNLIVAGYPVVDVLAQTTKDLAILLQKAEDLLVKMASDKSGPIINYN